VRQGRIELKKKAEVLGAYLTAAEHAAEGAHRLAINSYMAAGKVEARNRTPQEQREWKRDEAYRKREWEKAHPPMPGGHYDPEVAARIRQAPIQRIYEPQGESETSAD